MLKTCIAMDGLSQVLGEPKYEENPFLASGSGSAGLGVGAWESGAAAPTATDIGRAATRVSTVAK
jgi:hypothetical protein